MSEPSKRSADWAVAFVASLHERGEIAVEPGHFALLEQRLAEAMDSELGLLQMAYVNSQETLLKTEERAEFYRAEAGKAEQEAKRWLQRNSQWGPELRGLRVVAGEARQLCDLLLVEPERLSPVECGLAEHVMLVLATRGPKEERGDDQG
jgi:hypothetical protein